MTRSLAWIFNLNVCVPPFRSYSAVQRQVMTVHLLSKWTTPSIWSIDPDMRPSEIICEAILSAYNRLNIIRYFQLHFTTFRNDCNSFMTLLVWVIWMGPSKIKKLLELPESRSDGGNFSNFCKHKRWLIHNFTKKYAVTCLSIKNQNY